MDFAIFIHLNGQRVGEKSLNEVAFRKMSIDLRYHGGGYFSHSLYIESSVFCIHGALQSH